MEPALFSIDGASEPREVLAGTPRDVRLTRIASADVAGFILGELAESGLIEAAAAGEDLSAQAQPFMRLGDSQQAPFDPEAT